MCDMSVKQNVTVCFVGTSPQDGKRDEKKVAFSIPPGSFAHYHSWNSLCRLYVIYVLPKK
jgi:hypothetical protein